MCFQHNLRYTARHEIVSFPPQARAPPSPLPRPTVATELSEMQQKGLSAQPYPFNELYETRQDSQGTAATVWLCKMCRLSNTRIIQQKNAEVEYHDSVSYCPWSFLTAGKLSENVRPVQIKLENTQSPVSKVLECARETGRFSDRLWLATLRDKNGEGGETC